VPIDTIALRKLLKLLYLPPNKRQSAIRTEIRNQIAKEADPDAEGGGDFHIPFWSDAKQHVYGKADLQQRTLARVEANGRRKRLYPELTEGFLEWWQQEKRWRNLPIVYVPTKMKSKLLLEEIGVTIKIDNIMTLAFEGSGHMHVYPYFSESPDLNAEAARIGLWVINEAFKGEHADMRILDVLRGQAFRKSEQKFRGDEREYLLAMCMQLISEWETLWDEYQ